MPWALWAMGGGGAIFGATVVLPAAIAIARVDLPRTPAALLTCLVWGGACGTAVYLWGNINLGMAAVVLLATASALPTGALGVGIGAVGGALKAEKACVGNLKRVGKAFSQYLRDHGRWPVEAHWVDELLPYLPYPKAFRCPVPTMRPYHYRRPREQDPPDTPIIVCRHVFIGKAAVLRKDLKVEELPVDEVPWVSSAHLDARRPVRGID